MALNSTHIISEVPNLINTFALILIVIILSFNNSGDMVEVCSVHVRRSNSHSYSMHTFMANITYRFHNFLALNSTHIISEVLNLTSTFVLMLIVIILSFINSGDMVEVCSVHVRRSNSHSYSMHTFMANITYRFHNFLALNSTHIISEAPNLISTFVLLLIVII